MSFDAGFLDLNEEKILSKDQQVTQEHLHHYAWASGDYNPIHYNALEAQKMGLPSVIAHGMLTLAYMNKMVEGIIADISKHSGKAARFSAVDTRFVGMLQVGDTVSISAKVFKIKDESLQLQLWAFKNSMRDQLVCTATATVNC